MTSKDWKWIAIACLLVIVSYQVGKYHGENSAESRSRERELAFQKEKEATRKSEHAELLRIQKEEKRVAEKRRREVELVESMDKSRDRQMALTMQAMQAITQRQPLSIGGYPSSSYTTKTPRQGRISSIVGTEDNHIALIGTKLVREGDIIDGVTVVKIHEDEVEFEKNGKRWAQKVCQQPNPAWR